MATHHKTRKETESHKQNNNISLSIQFLLYYAYHKTQKETKIHKSKIPSHAANNTIIVQTQQAIHQR